MVPASMLCAENEKGVQRECNMRIDSTSPLKIGLRFLAEAARIADFKAE